MRALLLALLIGQASAMPAHVVRVIDGDTVEVDGSMWVLIGGQGVQMKVPLAVRILGINAPELHGAACERPAAVLARDFAVSWLGAGDVDLQIAGLDKFAGRIDGTIRRPDGASLGDALMAAGLARAYSGGTRPPWCQ